MQDRTKTRFEEAAASHKDRSVARELWEFLRENKRWWLLPIVVVLLMFSVLLMLSGTAMAPFIYTLF